MSAARWVNLPTGTVPSLKDFTRHVWRFRDEDGDTVLVSPPGDIFTLVIDDAHEADAAVSAAKVIRSLGFSHRASIKFDGPNVVIGFRDLTAVREFLCVLSIRSQSLPARDVAAYCMSLLGFRWL